MLEISGFTPEDRDHFLQRWFRGDKQRLAVAEKVIRENPDIDLHTRLPLIATLVAALIENNFEPTTRAEIYDQRLQLLIDRWESVKGLNRSIVPRKAQLRLLRHLAYDVHKHAAGRSARFSLEQFRHAFGYALGRFGDKVDPDLFLNNLLMVSGVLVREGEDYSFGHLSFQEHLVGAFLADSVPAYSIEELLGLDWWTEPLKFYAGITLDITELIETCEQAGSTPIHKRQLRELLAFAPHTASVAADIVDATREDISR